MKAFCIWVDGQAYRGESGHAVPANVGGEGWHTHNHGMVAELEFADGSPKIIHGSRNLRSHVERILRALCQRCHLRHDHEHHQRNAAATRRSGKAAGDLFDAPQPVKSSTPD